MSVCVPGQRGSCVSRTSVRIQSGSRCYWQWWPASSRPLPWVCKSSTMAPFLSSQGTMALYVWIFSRGWDIVLVVFCVFNNSTGSLPSWGRCRSNWRCWPCCGSDTYTPPARFPCQFHWLLFFPRPRSTL
jgi:hypothetical protein